MKKTLFYLFVLITSQNSIFAQCGETGSEILIESESDLLAYQDCDTIYGSLKISGSNISYLIGLQNLKYVEENLTIESCISMLDVDSLYNLEEVGGNFELNSNFTLLNLNGLSSLQKIGGDFLIDTNWSIENMEGLESLEEIGGDLYFFQNNTLQSVDGLENLTQIQGSLLITTTNMVFEDLSGLNGLEEVGGGVLISINSLTTINGLENLTTVGGSFEIVDLTLLANTNGLVSLESIGQDLNLYDNGTLVNVDSLYNLTFVGGDVNVHSNPSLFLCCGLRPLLANGTVVGEINIYDNSNNCDSLDELLEECWVSIPENTEQLVRCFRDENNDIHVSSEIPIDNIELYSVDGRLVADFTSLNAGNHVLKKDLHSIILLRYIANGQWYSVKL